MIAECPITLACRVKHELSLGSHNIFIAEVVAIHCDDKLVRKDGKADPFPEEQIVYLNKKYWIPRPAE
ncbi:MAG TPA: flavin reductase, partial [Bacteroidetes bacterium]|nr:flavin reductase [Bacteroidota bacterium]